MKINAGDVEDKAWIDDIIERGKKIEKEAEERKGGILRTVGEIVGE